MTALADFARFVAAVLAGSAFTLFGIGGSTLLALAAIQVGRAVLR